VKHKLLFLFFLGTLSISAQNTEILGKVTGVSDVENIHVINKRAQAYTITDENGEFKIPVKHLDTIVFSSIRYKLKKVIVTHQMVYNKAIFVTLDEQVNELDEIIVGKILTGDLFSDVGNTEGDRPINFFDVGIPGYTGKIATQSERKLSEASGYNTGLGSSGYGLGASIGFTPIINAITGRTKKLKRRVKLDRKETLMQSIKDRVGRDFFASNPLEEDYRMDFLYFCSDDPRFFERCENETDFNILLFLRMKYNQYNANRGE
jgi:hypothetical protein